MNIFKLKAFQIWLITDNSKASGNSKIAFWANLHEVLTCSFQDLSNIEQQINNRELVSSYIANSYSILEILLLKTWSQEQVSEGDKGEGEWNM